MGLCFSSKAMKTKASNRISHDSAATGGGGGGDSSNRWTRNRSTKKENFEDSVIHERALAAAILFQQHLQNGGDVQFDRSTSLRCPPANGRKQPAFPRSSSSRARSLTDALLQPHQLLNQVLNFMPLNS